MLPHARGSGRRPGSAGPTGSATEDHQGPVFFHKNLAAGTPDWVDRGTIAHREHDNTYRWSTTWRPSSGSAQLAALEIHVPQWRFGARRRRRKNPDRLVLDLDPGEGVRLAECAEVARWVRDILADMGHEPVPVTSGSKGIHLYAALDGSQTSEQATEVAHELALRARSRPSRPGRQRDEEGAAAAGKVFVDWSQNNGAKTTVSPYSLRGRVHPTVAAPRTWEELADPDLAQLDVRGGAAPGGRRATRSPRCRRLADRSAGRPAPTGCRRTAACAIAAQDPGAGAAAGESITSGDRWTADVRHPGAPRPGAALGLPAGARRRAGQLGGAQGATDRPEGEPSRRADRGPSAGVRRASRERSRTGEYGGGQVSIWDAGTYDDPEVARRQGGHRHAAPAAKVAAWTGPRSSR